MTRKRLRPLPTDVELKELYAAPHDHYKWLDHHLRVNATITVGQWMLRGVNVQQGADLSCGNGAILEAMPVIQQRYFGDFAPGYPICGPIEQTINDIPEVDIFVNSETLEHVDDPDAVLTAIRAKTRYLLLSTPIDCWEDDNQEHLWAWSREDLEEMLQQAGFRILVFSSVDFRPLGMPYCFGIWGAT